MIEEIDWNAARFDDDPAGADAIPHPMDRAWHQQVGEILDRLLAGVFPRTGEK